MTTKIELSVVEEILREALDTDVHFLEGQALDDSKSIREKREQAAELTRDLLHLADNLELAANLVRQQYWRVKGYDGVTDATLVPRGVA